MDRGLHSRSRISYFWRRRRQINNIDDELRYGVVYFRIVCASERSMVVGVCSCSFLSLLEQLDECLVQVLRRFGWNLQHGHSSISAVWPGLNGLLELRRLITRLALLYLRDVTAGLILHLLRRRLSPVDVGWLINYTGGFLLRGSSAKLRQANPSADLDSFLLNVHPEKLHDVRESTRTGCL